jgi:hypothetical protein
MTVDEPCARELLDRLARAEPPASRVDVGLIRRRGRRIVFWRRIGAPGASALAVVAVAGLISSNVLSLGTHNPASGPVHPRTAFNPLVPYASFGWLPAGFTFSAGTSIRWWGKYFSFSDDGTTQIDRATTHNVQVNVGSPARGQTIALTVNSANYCTLGPPSPPAGKIMRNLRKRNRHVLLPPYQLMCGDGGGSVGPVVGTVNGSPAYGGGWGLTWQYAARSWAQLQLGQNWPETYGSTAANAMLFRIADHIRFGESTSELFAFRLHGVPKRRYQSITSYDEYRGRLVNTTLWLGTNSMPTVGDMVEIAVTPGKPTSCRYVQGQSVAQGRFSYVTLDGTRFTVRTMGLDQAEWTTQELCGYVHGQQVNIGVQVQASSRSRLLPGPLSSLTGTSGQSAAVSVFRHLTLLGPNPADWTTHPLG